MTPRLSARSLKLRRGDSLAVSGASLTLCAGEFVGVVGPNGAGKSTLLSLLAGVAAADEGEITYGEAPAGNLSAIERARRLAYLPQARPVYWSLPVRDLVTLGRFAYGTAGMPHARDAAAVERAMRAAGVDAFAERPAHALSGGELMRVHLARLLASDAPLLIADEPATALDPAWQFRVMEILRARASDGAAVIVALHDLPMALRYCSQLLAMNNGEIIFDGAPTDFLAANLASDVFGVSINVTKSTDGDAYALAPAPSA